MKTLFTLSLIICIATAVLKGQAVSSLIKTGENGKLEYIPFANKGETNKVNIIPDFSFAGYKYGGVEIPEAPVVLTLSPVAGDNHQQIQDAIDAVAAMPVNELGFRGAILFEPGTYQVDAPLIVHTSGIVLRGSAQMPGDQSGTELIANARYMHDFITFLGESTGESIGFLVDTILIPLQGNGFWVSANVKAAVEQEFEGDKVMSLNITADGVDEWVAYSSKENTDHSTHPYLKLTLFLNQQEKDTLIILTPVDDAYIRGGEFALENYGSEPILAIKNRGVNNRLTREILMKFVLPVNDAQIVDAELFLYCRTAPRNDEMLNFVTLLDDDNWSEETINYANQPAEVSRVNITTDYVPSGATRFMVSSTAGYKVGDKIIVMQTPNQAWIDLISMTQIGWTPSGYRISNERTIVAISGNEITIDVPLVQAITKQYGGGEMFTGPVKPWINHCGVENMFLSSHYASEQDEEHGWNAIAFNAVEDSWVKNVTGRNFGHGLIRIYDGNRNTVQDCAFLDPKSITTGWRKYSFNISKGSFNLFQRLYARGGRHDFMTGARVAGPNVFVDCVAQETQNDIGPHERYATGILFDNIQGGQTRVWNRGTMGTGQGWSGAQIMFWNLVSNDEIRVDSPPNAMNWGIGCTGNRQSGTGYWEKWGMHVLPRSLYYQQLQDRLGEDAVLNTTIPAQHSGRIYDVIKNWKGFGELTEYLPSNNPYLADLRINGETVHLFVPTRMAYVVILTSDTVPEIDVTPYFESSKIEITHPYSLPGAAEITVTAGDGITETTYIVNYNLNTTSIETVNEGSFNVYPNPAGNFILLEHPDAMEYALKIKIYNLIGQQIMQQDISGNDSKIDISSLSPGVYFISLQKESGLKEIKRFVKKFPD